MLCGSSKILAAQSFISQLTMKMSDFLFIVPEGWTRIPQEMVDQIGAIGIDGWVKASDYGTLGAALREIGGPESISEAVFFNSEILAVR